MYRVYSHCAVPRSTGTLWRALNEWVYKLYAVCVCVCVCARFQGLAAQIKQKKKKKKKQYIVVLFYNWSLSTPLSTIRGRRDSSSINFSLSSSPSLTLAFHFSWQYFLCSLGGDVVRASERTQCPRNDIEIAIFLFIRFCVTIKMNPKTERNFSSSLSL